MCNVYNLTCESVLRYSYAYVHTHGSTTHPTPIRCLVPLNEKYAIRHLLLRELNIVLLAVIHALNLYDLSYGPRFIQVKAGRVFYRESGFRHTT